VAGPGGEHVGSPPFLLERLSGGGGRVAHGSTAERSWSGVTYAPDSQHQHTALVEAVLDGDEEAARAVMREHCAGTAELLRSFLA
jgi:DNA-binding FadR family transcriptional regulator